MINLCNIHTYTHNIVVLSYTLYILYYNTCIYNTYYYIIIICDVRTQWGINHVIGLRKFIQSSTIDLYEPLGAKMFYFLFLLLQKKTLLLYKL